MKTWAARLAACALLGGAPAASRAQEASAPDSTLERFLGGLADSTDRYFGLIAAPLDTAGLDSALAAGLEKPWSGPRSRRQMSFKPVYAFNRVDGSLWGAGMGISDRDGRLRLEGDLGWTDGSEAWLGGGELSLRWGRGETAWRLRVAGGRRTEDMDRDRGEAWLATLRALFMGNDRKNYLRRDGFVVGIGTARPTWQAGITYRDRLESPLPVTKLWNLTNSDPERTDNLAALPGRARELGLAVKMSVPGLPVTLRAVEQIADGAFRSDFDYSRARVALGAEIAAGRRISFVPQAAYGRLTGDPVPQAALYLGGAPTLRSLPGESQGGTGLAVARLDVIAVDDLLALAHIPHPAMFPIQGALFVGTGAVWGADPFGGPGSAGGGWPDRSAWQSEVGAALLYRPGFPEGDSYFRINAAWRLGPARPEQRWTVSFARALDLLGPF